MPVIMRPMTVMANGCWMREPIPMPTAAEISPKMAVYPVIRIGRIRTLTVSSSARQVEMPCVDRNGLAKSISPMALFTATPTSVSRPMPTD